MNDEQRLEEIFDLTSRPGWKLIVDDLNARIELIKDGLINGEVSAYNQGLAQGHVKVYQEFINLRTTIEYLMQQKKEDDEQAAAV